MCSEEENRTAATGFICKLTHSIRYRASSGSRHCFPFAEKPIVCQNFPCGKIRKDPAKERLRTSNYGGATEEELSQQLFLGDVVTVKQLTAGDWSSTICSLGIHSPFTRFPLWIKTDGNHLTSGHTHKHMLLYVCVCPPDGLIAKIWAHFWKTFNILNLKDVNVHFTQHCKWLKVKCIIAVYPPGLFWCYPVLVFRIHGAFKVFLSGIMFLFFIYFTGFLKIYSHKHKKSFKSITVKGLLLSTQRNVIGVCFRT